MCDVLGFLLYVFMLFSLQLSIVKKNYLSLTLVLLFITFIAAFRGTSGVDTYMYLLRFDAINSIFNIPIIEFFIPFLMWCSKVLGGSFITFSILFGLIMSLTYLYIFKKIPTAIYFGLAMFPVIFIDSLFNGIRIGLAYPFIFLAIYFSSKQLFLIAFFSHVSAFMILPFKIIPFRYFVFITILIIGYILYKHINILDYLSERYIAKLTRYQDMSTKNIYSGIADSSLMFISIIIYIRAIGIRGKKFMQWMFFLLIGTISIHILLISQYTFMLRIIRLYDIVIFALIAKQSTSTDKFSLNLAFIFGIFYTLNFLRQINSTCSYPIGGFLPLNFNLF